MKFHTSRAFTIVELLIVIVVIAVLAAISIVSYNGIQQRAYNTATIASAQQTIKLIDAYIIERGIYPSAGSVCATKEIRCTGWDGSVLTANNSSLLDALSTIGSPVASPPKGDANGYYGINYNYYSPRTYEGVSSPLYIRYWLKGEGVNCSVKNVTTGSDTGQPSTAGYSYASNGRTYCYVHIDGPPHA